MGIKFQTHEKFISMPKLFATTMCMYNVFRLDLFFHFGVDRKKKIEQLYLLICNLWTAQLYACIDTVSKNADKDCIAFKTKGPFLTPQNSRLHYMLQGQFFSVSELACWQNNSIHFTITCIIPPE